MKPSKTKYKKGVISKEDPVGGGGDEAAMSSSAWSILPMRGLAFLVTDPSTRVIRKPFNAYLLKINCDPRYGSEAA